LKLVCAQEFAYEKIIGAVVAEFRRSSR
jgi:hypothetical protein